MAPHRPSPPTHRRGVLLAGAALALLAAAPAPDPSPILLSEFIDPTPPYPQAHASTLAELPDGTLAAAWFGGTAEGAADVAIWFARRTPGGWSKPVAVATGHRAHAPREPAWNPVLFQPPGAPLQLFYKLGPDPNHWRGMVIASPDGGRHWSAPRPLPRGILGPSKNKPVVAPDGAWLAPSSRERGVFPHDRWSVRIERSTDHGASWRAEPPIASPLGLAAIQPTLFTYKDGRLELIARTRQGVLAMSWSRDAGRSWSPLVAAALPNPNAGVDGVTLADGRQLLVYNHAAHWPDQPGYGPRYPLDVALSDDGVYWRHALTLEQVPRPEGYAYPAVIQTRDGLVHVSYSWNRTRIRHVVLDPARLR